MHYSPTSRFNKRIYFHQKNDDGNMLNTVVVLDSLAKISGYLFLLAIVFSVFKLHFLYIILLHVPIFQLLDISEIIMFAPSVLGYVFTYVSLFVLHALVSKNRPFIHSIITLFLMVYLGINMFSNPNNLDKNSFFFLYLSILIPLGIGSIILNQYKSKEIIKGKLLIYLPFIVVFYFSFTESLLQYSGIVWTNRFVGLNLTLKTGANISSNAKFKYISKTGKYWFFYDLKKEDVNIIKDEDVSHYEFNTNIVFYEEEKAKPIPPGAIPCLP